MPRNRHARPGISLPTIQDDPNRSLTAIAAAAALRWQGPPLLSPKWRFDAIQRARGAGSAHEGCGRAGPAPAQPAARRGRRQAKQPSLARMVMAATLKLSIFYTFYKFPSFFSEFIQFKGHSY